ncbi:glycosyltransferase [Gulosibacter bifidus]|uniref:Glycosyltransferase n=1 Tax=Gulosibacter bifidus TaxID=272239 RepID=A0ABW5RJ11_9MICO
MRIPVALVLRSTASLFGVCVRTDLVDLYHWPFGLQDGGFVRLGQGARDESGRYTFPRCICWLGCEPLDELRVLLGGSEAVVYASIAEGFGLPVLEAMASGAAVVSTRLSALPEVGGDAVRYVEPNAASIAGALQELLANDQLRADYARAGAERAAGFTWAACAATHLEAYRVALAG